MSKSTVLLPVALVAATGLASADDTGTVLQITSRAGGGFGVQMNAGAAAVLNSPAEGLWSIACDWRDQWPAAWSHGSPSRRHQSGPWTILAGEMQACGGTWEIEDSYRPSQRRMEVRRRFRWKGTAPAPKVTLSVRYQAQARSVQALLPGILYYGNPSGARSGRVPLWGRQPGEFAVYEEHRYPMPFAYLELDREGGLLGAALHTVPSPVAGGNLADQWWSMGVAGLEGGAELTLLSGPCASNGKRSVIKAAQRGFLPYDNPYIRLAPGEIVEKSFALEVFPVHAEGRGFQQAVRTALDRAGSFDPGSEPPIAGIVRDKYRYATGRWSEWGYRKYANRKEIVMGWTGQAEALGYALQVLAPGLEDPQALGRAQAALDFLSGAAFFDGGFHNWYNPETETWFKEELLNQGQAMLSFARAIERARGGSLNPAKWEAFLRKAADVHAARILRPDWNPMSTNEAGFIAPLAAAFRLFGVERYRVAARKAGDTFARRHLSMREPYWGGTLDASCEDKEAAALATEGFLALYDLTQEASYLDWAGHAADVALSYVVTWNIDLPPGRLRDHQFRTKGWTSVSVQNQHLDVWGVLMAADIYRLGQLTKRPELQQLGLLMYRTCGQLIDPMGGQGEQMNHTNYTQSPESPTLRGAYNENWTVFWITAHFLTGAARLAELGVTVWE